jgi:hypothetical protein
MMIGFENRPRFRRGRFFDSEAGNLGWPETE